ncbi:uncharacterized protein B0P05DRAFT_577814 [Gilbertella persicaria]|uniref:uncharacterized protein n=1 Tax=Gilbertella persicaria TaxID=101096 RepID=UPI00221EA32A|nr:uncharacterized protein B0P05DRAFT_577814 [Gilbertella persicaria]KAI8087916.1 hypothetical protein B0P05DRAFT_577814 [Gilbertella persicaria]
MDKEVIRLRDQNRSPEYYMPTGAAFVTFRSAHSAQICAQIVTSWKPGIMVIRIAPEPRDVLWRSLLRRGRKSQMMGIIRQWVVFAAVWSLTIFWLFPITFILGLTSIQSLSQHFSFLRYFLASSLVVRSFVQNILPTLLVTLFMSLLPWILLEISKQQDFVSYSELEDTVLGRYYHFAIFNVLIVFLLGTTFLTTMLDVLYEPTMLIQLLANALPQGANFFLNYILFNSSTHAMELVQLGSQLFGHLLLTLPFISRTPRMRMLHTKPWSFPFYYYYPNHILVLVITLTYSVIQPLILIFALIYYSFALAVYRHQYMYCYLRRYETHGSRHYRRVTRYTSDGLLIFQLTMVGLLYLKGVLAAATTLLPLIIFTVWFKVKLNRLFQRRTKHPYTNGCWLWHQLDDIWKFSYIGAWWASGRYAQHKTKKDISVDLSDLPEQCQDLQAYPDDSKSVHETYEHPALVTPLISELILPLYPNLHFWNLEECVHVPLDTIQAIFSRLYQKLASLRAQAEQATALAEEYEAKIKQLELEHTSKDHELLSLQIRAKNLEEQLDKTEEKLHQTSASYNEADLKAEEAERKVQTLEQELADKEQLNEELQEKYKSIKSELDELSRQFEEL